MKSIQLVSLEWASRKFNITMPALWHSIHRNRLPRPVIVGRGYRFVLSELIEFVRDERNRVTPRYKGVGPRGQQNLRAEFAEPKPSEVAEPEQPAKSKRARKSKAA
jgi:predicted DNA-binding transcriptional regulator AlpA